MENINLESLYDEQERIYLTLSYSFFTQHGSKVRDIANALIKAYFPYQTPEGRPLKKGRDKFTGKQVWKKPKITSAEAERVVKKCIFAYIDHKYGDPVHIEVHEDGDPVEK